MQISRRDLYNRVWSTPMIKLARELDISDVGLAKACRRYNIPRPARGYWAKLAAGKAPPKPGLPPGKIDTVEFDAARHCIPTPPKVEVDPALSPATVERACRILNAVERALPSIGARFVHDQEKKRVAQPRVAAACRALGQADRPHHSSA